MDQVAQVVDLTTAQFAALVALFLPGFVSLQVDWLIQPSARRGASELVLEAFGYSLVNAGLLFPLVLFATAELARPRPNWVGLWGAAVGLCAVGPAIWPALFRASQRWAAKRKLILGTHHYAWDNFFSRGEPCWLIFHMSDGGAVAGYFGRDSYATAEPASGHIYVEELWRLDEAGRIAEAIPDSKGALFRPGDYHWVEIFEDDKEA